MDFTAVVSSLLRRWYIALAGLLVTAGLVGAAFQLVPPTYSATASMLLLPPEESLTAGANPLLQLGGLEQPASLAVAYLGGNDVHRQFAEQFPGATYSAVVDTLGRGPLIIFTAEAATPDGALAALQGAVDRLPEALTTLQDNVDAPERSRVRSTSLSVDQEATTVRGSTLRAVILAGGVGLVITFAGAVAVDSLMARRAARRAERRRPARDDYAPAKAVPAAPGEPADDMSTPWVARTTAPRRS